MVIPSAIELIQNLYDVIRYTTPLKTPANKTLCNGKPIPSELATTGIPNTDLYIIVSWVHNSSANFVAKALACAKDATTSRPYFGTIEFNTRYLHLDDSRWKYTLSVTLHEMHHVLYFSYNLFPHYIDPATLKRKEISGYIHIDGIKTLVLIDPLIVQAARKYFNCDSMKFVRLENQGGAGSRGSHWERKWFGNEFITAETSNRMAISEITLAVAEASGWYKPNYTLAEKLYWGRNGGCRFVDDKCISGDPLIVSGHEFCTEPGAHGCDFESVSPSRCFTLHGTVPNPAYWDYYGENVISGDKFTDNCAIQAKHGDQYCGPGGYSTGRSPEYFGTNSACFKSGIVYEDYHNIMEGRCYEYKCLKTENSRSYRLHVHVGSQAFNCTFRGEPIHTNEPGLKGSLICPDPQLFCEIKMETCDKACGGIGACVNGECVCPSGRIGPDCLRHSIVENDPKCACSYPAASSYNGNCVYLGFNCSTDLLPSATQCSACIPHCIACTDVNLCTSCKYGYIVSNGTCILSNDTASSRNTSTPASISVNSSSFESNNSNRSLLQTNAEKAPNKVVVAPNAPRDISAKLFTCQSNQFYDLKANLCVDCPNGCSSCTNSTFCTTCSSEYLHHFGKCFSCPIKCSQCEIMNTSSGPAWQFGCKECTHNTYILKRIGEINLCVSRTLDILSLSAIIAGMLGGTIILIASIYCFWSTKTVQKRNVIKKSSV